MADMKAGLIGCGFFAVNQMHAWQDVDGASVVAICDRDPERLRIVGDQFGIERRYADAGEMLASEKLDFVDVATTVGSHRALVELAAAHKLPVICQKPFAPTLEDAKAMVEACKAAGVPLMIHENFRWQSPIQAVKAAIDTGAIGTPFFGRISFRSAYDVFSGQPYLAKGKRFIIEDLGIHILDIARFLLGDVTTLTARTRRVNPAIAGEDVATMLLDHQSGATSVVDCSYATKLAVEPFPETLVEIDGDKGTIRLDQGFQLTVTGEAGSSTTDVSPPLLPWASRPWHNIQESVLTIQQHWVDCLRSGRDPDTSGADNLKTFALVEAAYLGAASGQPVAVADLL
ncbi:Gfo/Idh/MocA family oxidoreductase [Pseudaminobacter sp. 19-2017]|uniref:Gfo/Idh/MocA family oxidoreductase n=1 Tax=Pseudaminobacter soli (ex Zhang et al. 2022) TaxID=2831468 RepID=A0A942I6Y1_9HYPH|nr:Gfo/Idh/MocA family oxidoreductase [Pseudaminobacter soli]MBS3647810.1 Gfo/Idh/MocA family oxidoreductase [Pseudaminobacter soli]